MLIPFSFPLRMMVAGPSGCGKSTFVSQLVKNKQVAFSEAPKRILYFAKYKTSVPEEIIGDVEFVQGLPEDQVFENSEKIPTLLIIDDLQDDAFNSSTVIGAFQNARHQNFGLVILSQNLFPRNKRARDISLNCNYLLVFYNPRDSSSIIPLSRQLDSLNPSVLSQIYFKHINCPYKYLLIDLEPTTSSLLKYRSDIFSEAPEVYVSKENFENFENAKRQSSSNN
jgi:hypothetical protein